MKNLNRILLNLDSEPGLPPDGKTAQPTGNPAPAGAPAAPTGTDRLHAIEAEIGTGLNLVANIAGGLDPALLPLIVLGKAAAAAMPGLIDDVAALMVKSDPTDADNTALATKIHSLLDPAKL